MKLKLNDGTIIECKSYEVIEDKKQYWEPRAGNAVFSVGFDGCHFRIPEVDQPLAEQLIGNHNAFETPELAEKASRLMSYSNALIRAKLLVEPDFEPDWSDHLQHKWMLRYDHQAQGWFFSMDTKIQRGNVVFSASEKVEEAIELLKEWGVKPPGGK